MTNLSKNDKNFLKRHLPQIAINAENMEPNEVLEAIYDFINAQGFAPPHYVEYNELGDEAQGVYDNILNNN